jgi:transposase
LLIRATFTIEFHAQAQLRGSFIPKAQIRHLRLLARQRQKLGGMLVSEKNRLHKVLADAGIRLGVLVSDIHGQAGRAMTKALIAGKPMAQVLDLAGRLRAKREDLFEALQPEELTVTHLFVLKELMDHIEDLEARIVSVSIQFDGLMITIDDAEQPSLSVNGAGVLANGGIAIKVSDVHQDHDRRRRQR